MIGEASPETRFRATGAGESVNLSTRFGKNRERGGAGPSQSEKWPRNTPGQVYFAGLCVNIGWYALDVPHYLAIRAICWVWLTKNCHIWCLRPRIGVT